MNRFEQWVALVLGVALNPDRSFGNQCVDVIDHIGEYLYGVAWQISVGGVEGARDLLGVAPNKYWQRIDYVHGFIPQRMDVLVFGGDKYNRFGHTAVVLTATRTFIDVMQQDGFGAPLIFVNGGWYSNKPAHLARLYYNQDGTGPLIGVLRPRPELFVGGLIPASTISTPTQEDFLMALPDNDQREVLAHARDTATDVDIIRQRTDDLPEVVANLRKVVYMVATQGQKIDAMEPGAIASIFPDEIAAAVLDKLAERLGRTVLVPAGRAL